MSEALPLGFEPFTEVGFMGHIAPLYIRRAGAEVELGAIVRPHQANPLGSAHGGFLMSIMDVTLGINCALAVGHDGVVATIQLNSNIVAAARTGEFIRAGATIEKVTRTLAFASGRIVAADRVILTATAIFRNPPAKA